jgi:hypothetical protein
MWCVAAKIQNLKFTFFNNMLVGAAVTSLPYLLGLCRTMVPGQVIRIVPMFEQEKRQRKPAIGYTRTNSAANIGQDKDSVVRQRNAIQAYANRAGYRIVAWFDDPAVTGADTIDARPGVPVKVGRGLRGAACSAIPLPTVAMWPPIFSQRRATSS